MQLDIQAAHRALCSGFVEEDMFRRALGGGRADISMVGAYFALPVAQRPALSVFFDRDYYAGLNPEVLRGGWDPLLHFLLHGAGQLRAPHPMVDLEYLAATEPRRFGDVRTIAALVELLEYDLASPSPYLDLAFYRRNLGAAPPGGCLRHYLSVGLWAGARANPHLDLEWYAATYPDVPRDAYGALRHFVVLGDVEGRAAGPAFDGRLYRARYRDIAASSEPPLRHYLTTGRHEGRQLPAERKAPTAPSGTHLDLATPPPIDPDAIARLHLDMHRRLARRRQARRDAVVRRSPVLVGTDLPAAALERLRLPDPGANPRLSVLIPAYNEFGHTLACLTTLVYARPQVAFEVILADDASTDSQMRRLGRVRHLVHLRQSRNLGFIGNCNAAFRQCRGELVLLLNNDTEVQPGAIDAMVAALDADPGIGAVGAKLIYPDGALQEAGCALKPDGQSVMVGLFGDPDEPGYAWDRDVAYCSGAALMLRRELAGDTLFDEAFNPAYCEDVDLCLRLIRAGFRIRYVAGAVVVHHLSVSTDRQPAARKQHQILRNTQRLTERWGEVLGAADRVRVLAFYLPQFHATPENDLWWGAGFTEWTNVAKARPSYAGHYQPHLPADLGFYDLANPDALARQAALAARYGIEGFCVYYYNLGGRRLLSRPLDVLRAHPEVPFRFCLCWANENWSRNWDGGTDEILLEQRYDEATLDAILADIVRDSADPRAIRVDGRPIFLVYRPLLLPDAPAFAARARAAFQAAGLPGVHLVYVESVEAVDRGVRPADLGFDAGVEFPPHGRGVPAESGAEIVKEGWEGYRYDYVETVMRFLDRRTVPYRRYPAVFPSWDNTPRQQVRGTSFDEASPDAFRFFVERKIEELRCFATGDHRLLFVNAWNEWAEGAHLEPDSGYGHRWLEALRDGIDAARFA